MFLIKHRVAPLAGAWIEIVYAELDLSLDQIVAPLAGAWIEMSFVVSKTSGRLSRSPRGSVD